MNTSPLEMQLIGIIFPITKQSIYNPNIKLYKIKDNILYKFIQIAKIKYQSSGINSDQEKEKNSYNLQ